MRPIVAIAMDDVTRAMLEAARFAVLIVRPRCAIRFCKSVVIERDGRIGFYELDVTDPTVLA